MMPKKSRIVPTIYNEQLIFHHQQIFLFIKKSRYLCPYEDNIMIYEATYTFCMFGQYL